MLKFTDKELVMMSEACYAMAQAEMDKDEVRDEYQTRFFAVEDFMAMLPKPVEKMLQPMFNKFLQYEDEAEMEQKQEFDSYAQNQLKYGTTETDILTKSLLYTIEQQKQNIRKGILPEFNFTIYSTMSLLNLRYRLQKHSEAGIIATTALLLIENELEFREDIF